MKTKDNPENIVVIGAGKVGASIAGKLFEAGRLSRIFDKHPNSIVNLSEIPEQYLIYSLEDIPEKPRLMIIAINENGIRLSDVDEMNFTNRVYWKGSSVGSF